MATKRCQCRRDATTQTTTHPWGVVRPESAAQPTPSDPEDGLIVEPVPAISLAFYRKHTEKMLRRYFYASMLVGRAPSILGEPISRGWVSCRRIKTFEDAVIFVLDIERCLKRLGAFDRAIPQPGCPAGVYPRGDSNSAWGEPAYSVKQVSESTRSTD